MGWKLLQRSQYSPMSVVRKSERRGKPPRFPCSSLPFLLTLHFFSLSPFLSLRPLSHSSVPLPLPTPFLSLLPPFQPVASDRQVSVTVQARPGTAATEKGRSRRLVSSELQTDLQSGDRIQDTGETGAVTSATTSARFTQLQPVPVGV